MWIILAGALTVLSPAKRLAVLLLLLATLMGLFQDVLDWPALAILGAIALLAWVRVENPTNRAVLLISEALLVLIAQPFKPKRRDLFGR